MGEGGGRARWVVGWVTAAGRCGRGDGRSWKRREMRERGGSDGNKREGLTVSDDERASSERGVEKRSERGMSAVERLALSAEASLRRGGAAGAGSGERATNARRQVRKESVFALNARDGAPSRRRACVLDLVSSGCCVELDAQTRD